MSAADRAFVRRHLAVTFAVTIVTAWFSYGYFHLDEYFQVLEPTRMKLAPGTVTGLPWEYVEQLRPWLQPAAYVVLGRLLGLAGVSDQFSLAFAFRLVTGLANVAALALYLRTTLPWYEEGGARRLHVRVAAWLGFLPYLFVRTSSESASMAALTAGWALALADTIPTGDPRRWFVPSLERPGRLLAAGALLGIAFEARFQTALASGGLLAWILFASAAPRARTVRGVGLLVAGATSALGIGAIADRWGYGVWTFPAWQYFRVNILEGAASLFGSEPPFGYFWMLPANVFFPVVVAVLVVAALAWVKWPFHPLTWSTLPFFLVHNLLQHKEERFLFPLAILATGLAALALEPPRPAVLGRGLGRVAANVGAWLWARRHGRLATALVLWNVAAATLLAFIPIGWNHNVRFTRFVHDRFGEELHATGFPEIELYPPPFHPVVWDIDKADADELERRIALGTAREWLITAEPVLPAAIEPHATLVYTELPMGLDPTGRAILMRGVEAYNDVVVAPLRRLKFLSLYRIERPKSALSAPRPNYL